MVFPLYGPSHSFGEFVATVSFIVLSCLAVILVSLAVQRAIRVFRPNHVRAAVGPGPGHDPEDPEAAFVSDGYWFIVEVWPAMAPGSLFRAMNESMLFGLLFGLPLFLLVRRLDRRSKVCVYRARLSPYHARLVHVEYFGDEEAAERRRAELLAPWNAQPFLETQPLTRRDVATLRREP
jgi:hypothetical protein